MKIKKTVPALSAGRSLHETFEWLASLNPKTRANMDIDAQILAILASEGYFEFYEEQAFQLGIGAEPFRLGIEAARALDASNLTPDIEKLHSDLLEMLPIFEESFNARFDSFERSQELAKNGSKTLVGVLEVQEKMLAQAAVLRAARRGLVSELDAAAKRKV